MTGGSSKLQVGQTLKYTRSKELFRHDSAPGGVQENLKFAAARSKKPPWTPQSCRLRRIALLARKGSRCALKGAAAPETMGAAHEGKKKLQNRKLMRGGLSSQ